MPPARCSTLWILALFVSLSACATIQEKPPQEALKPVPLPAPKAALPRIEDPFQEGLQRSQEEARRLERDGRLREALERWKIVLTIDPQYPEGRQKQEELEAKIREKYRQHMAAGKESLQRRDKLATQREFLAALRLDPQNREALEQLYASEELLGEQTAFARPLRKTAPPTRSETSRPSAMKPSPAEEVVEEEETGEEVSFAEAAEVFRRGDYLGAIDAFSRVLHQQPGMREAIEYQKLAYYNQGVAYVEREQYPEAMKMFDQVRKMQANFKRVDYYAQTAREKLAEQHNLAGIQHFKAQKLKEAIAEWDEALALNPKLENARRSQERAKRLLKSLEDVK